MDKNEILNKLIHELNNMSRDDLMEELDKYDIEYSIEKKDIYIYGQDNKIETKETDALTIKINGNEINIVE